MRFLRSPTKALTEARGRLRLAGNGADDAAVKDNGAVLRAGLAHLLDDSVGKRVDFGLGELALRGIVGAEADIKAVPVFPEAENVAGEGHAGIDKAEALAPAMGDNEIRLLPGSREGHADAGQIEALAGAVTDDHEAPLAQGLQEVVLGDGGIRDHVGAPEGLAQVVVFLDVLHGRRMEVKALLHGVNNLQAVRCEEMGEAEIVERAAVRVGEEEDGGAGSAEHIERGAESFHFVLRFREVPAQFLP